MDQSQEEELQSNTLQTEREAAARPNPISSKNIFTQFLFGWIRIPLRQAQKSSWSQDMHLDLDSADQVQKQKKAFKANFSRTGSVYKTIALTYKWIILELAVVCLSVAVLEFIVVNFSKKGMEILQKSQDVTERGTFLLLVFNFVMAALTSTFSSLISPYYSFKTDRLSLRVRSILMSMAQEKTMSAKFLNFQKNESSPEGSKKAKKSKETRDADFSLTEGTVSNIFQVDIPRIETLISSCYSLTSSSITVITATYYTVTVVGFDLVRFFLTSYFIFNMLYVFIYLANVIFLKRFLEAKDGRMTYLKNVLQNLAFVKVTALENFYAEKILQKRKVEIRRLIIIGLIKALGQVQTYFAFAAATISFMTYLSLSPGLISDYASFVAMTESVRKLKVNLSMLFVGATGVVNASVCVYRIDKFLLAGQKASKRTDYVVRRSQDSLDGEGKPKAIQVRKAHFKWSLEEKREIRAKNDMREIKRAGRPSTRSTNAQSVRTVDLLTVKTEDTEDFAKSKISEPDELNNLNQGLNQESGELNLDTNFRLKDIDFEVDSGDVVAVFGKNNAGKSSLLYSILGEMVSSNDDTKVITSGRIALLTQKRWIIKGTVLDNILLGSEYDSQRLREALRVSQLEKDIKTFSHGLDTLLGDTNDTVSGGQKARISIARCFYQESDILLLDDPTSSLDTIVAEKLMNNLLNNPIWKKKTCIFTTNKARMLEFCHKAIFLKNGRIRFYGSPAEFKETEFYEDLFQLQERDRETESLDERLRLTTKKEDSQGSRRGSSKDTQNNDSNEARAEYQSPSSQESSLPLIRDPKLIAKPSSLLPKKEGNEGLGKIQGFYSEESHKRTGGISPKVYFSSLRLLGGAFWLLFLIGACFLSNGIFMACDVLILSWGESAFVKKVIDYSIILKIGLLYLVGLVAQFVYQFFMFRSGVLAAANIFCKMVFRVLHSKVSGFLELVPLGVLLNRFSTDVDKMDFEIPNFINKFFFMTALCFFSAYKTVIAGKSLISLFFLLIYTMVALVLRERFMKLQREVFRLLAVTRSPIVGLGTSSVAGGPVIRALNKEKVFQTRMDHYIDENSKNVLLLSGITQGFSTKMALYNLLLVYLPLYSQMLYTVYTTASSGQGQDYKSIALFIVSVVHLCPSLKMTMTNVSTLENNIIFYERCKEFEEVEPEQGYLIFKRDEAVFNKVRTNLKEVTQLVKSQKRKAILKKGVVEVRNVSARYPSGDNLVLKNINLRLESGQKLGIIGRTGAGKSSFVKLLWRALDIEEGQILIDGSDIELFDLKEYRSQLTVISQKTNLFEGTIAENISHKTLSSYEETEIMDHLDDLGFDQNKLRGEGLEFWVTANGDNLSLGEKQIICMVRAIFNKTKVVVFDEATAYVDSETEKKFQDKVKQCFRSSTLVVIAHRIDTVLDCDRIAVFDGGEIVEEGSVNELLLDEGSTLRKLYELR